MTPYRQQQRFIDAVDAAFLHDQIKAVTGGDFPSLAVEFRPADVSMITRLSWPIS